MYSSKSVVSELDESQPPALTRDLGYLNFREHRSCGIYSKLKFLILMNLVLGVLQTDPFESGANQR